MVTENLFLLFSGWTAYPVHQVSSDQLDPILLVETQVLLWLEIRPHHSVCLHMRSQAHPWGMLHPLSIYFPSLKVQFYPFLG
jgi:hypothetical protein